MQRTISFALLERLSGQIKLFCNAHVKRSYHPLKKQEAILECFCVDGKPLAFLVTACIWDLGKKALIDDAAIVH